MRTGERKTLLFWPTPHDGSAAWPRDSLARERHSVFHRSRGEGHEIKARARPCHASIPPGLLSLLSAFSSLDRKQQPKNFSDLLPQSALFQLTFFPPFSLSHSKPGYNTMYCFVEYADPSMAQCALALDGLQLGSRQIKVSVARSPSNPPGGGGMGGGGGMAGGQRGGMHAVAAAAAAAAAAYGGPGGRPGGGGGGYGMPPPHFQQGGGFQQHHHQQHGGGGGGAGGGRGNNHDPVRVAKTIFVDGVPLTVSEETLATFFSMCGAVFAVRLTPPAPSGDSRRAWVEFENLESARLALQYDSTVMGGSTLRVSASRSQIHTNGLRETVAPPEGVPLGLPRPQAAAPEASGAEGAPAAGEGGDAAAARAGGASVTSGASKV